MTLIKIQKTDNTSLLLFASSITERHCFKQHGLPHHIANLFMDIGLLLNMSTVLDNSFSALTTNSLGPPMARMEITYVACLPHHTQYVLPNNKNKLYIIVQLWIHRNLDFWEVLVIFFFIISAELSWVHVLRKVNKFCC